MLVPHPVKLFTDANSSVFHQASAYVICHCPFTFTNISTKIKMKMNSFLSYLLNPHNNTLNMGYFPQGRGLFSFSSSNTLLCMTANAISL